MIQLGAARMLRARPAVRMAGAERDGGVEVSGRDVTIHEVDAREVSGRRDRTRVGLVRIRAGRQEPEAALEGLDPGQLEVRPLGEHLQLGLSIFFEVTGLVAGIHAGRLAAIHAGRGDLGVALTIHELEVLTKRSHLELPGVKSLSRGFRLLPASAYPDESHAYLAGEHPGGRLPSVGLPSAGLPAAVTAAAHFPGVDLMDGHVPATNLNAAAPPPGTGI